MIFAPYITFSVIRCSKKSHKGDRVLRDGRDDGKKTEEKNISSASKMLFTFLPFPFGSQFLSHRVRLEYFFAVFFYLKRAYFRISFKKPFLNVVYNLFQGRGLLQYPSSAQTPTGSLHGFLRVRTCGYSFPYTHR